MHKVNSRSLFQGRNYKKQILIFKKLVKLFKKKNYPPQIHTTVSYSKETIVLEINDSQNLMKLGQGCTTKLSDGVGEGIEFRFNWRCGWVATMVPNWEFRLTLWFPVAST